MSSTVNPTIGTPQLTTDELTVIVASLSCLIFFLVIMVLLCLLCRRDPLCCKAREYHDSHTDLATPPQYYSSTQTLVGPPCSRQVTGNENTHRQQSDSLFLIGLPSSYGLPSLAVPRLPSYESVRKKDRQRQIHMMIADRFGLNGPCIPEPPPSYEESIRQTVEIPCGVIGPLHESSDTIGPSDVSCGVIGPLHESSDTTGPSDVPCGVIGPLHEHSDMIGPSLVSCDVIGVSYDTSNTIGPLEVSTDVIGLSSPPCDVILDTHFDITGHLQAPGDMIGPLTASSHIIGPLNASSHGRGPAGVLSAPINVSDLPETHTDSRISPV